MLLDYRNKMVTLLFKGLRIFSMTVTLSLLPLYVIDAVTFKREHQCPPGYYIHSPRRGPEMCLPCQDGINFMPETTWHSKRKCENCSKIRDPAVEIEVAPCTRTNDTVILCVDGYYRQRARNVRDNDTCVKCSECEHITLNCHGYYDHVCCPPSYEVVLTEIESYVCKKSPVLCGPGEFYSQQSEQCTACPPGTFMTWDKHNKTVCDMCETVDHRPGQKIFQPCNRTYPTVFGCQVGYFRNVTLVTVTGHFQCVPCHRCQHEVRTCDQFSNSVCCDQPDMEVSDTGTGLECRSKSTMPPPGLGATLSPGTTEANNGENSTEWRNCVNMKLNIPSIRGQATCQPCQESHEDILPDQGCTELLVEGRVMATILSGTPDSLQSDLLLTISLPVAFFLVFFAAAAGLMRTLQKRRKANSMRNLQKNQSYRKYNYELEEFQPMLQKMPVNSLYGALNPISYGVEADFASPIKISPMNLEGMKQIPVYMFNSSLVPVEFQDRQILEYIRNVCDRTVLVSVSVSCESTPDIIFHKCLQLINFYTKSASYTQHAIGYLDYVKVKEKSWYTTETCNCPKCETSLKPETNFGELNIVTLGHVVSNDVLAKQSHCKIFFHTTEQDQFSISTITLRGGKIVHDQLKEKTIIRYWTHDLRFAQCLQEICSRSEHLGLEMKEKYSKMKCEASSNLSVVVTFPTGSCQYVSLKFIS